MSNGWICLHRSLKNWGWRSSPKHLSVFIDFLIEANHKPREYLGIKIKPGQLTTSYAAIAERTGLSIRNVRTVIKDLISTQEVTCQNMRKCSLITITCWDKFQVPGKASDTQPTLNRHSSDTQVTTNNNVTSKQGKKTVVKNDNSKEKNKENKLKKKYSKATRNLTGE